MENYLMNGWSRVLKSGSAVVVLFFSDCVPRDTGLMGNGWQPCSFQTLIFPYPHLHVIITSYTALLWCQHDIELLHANGTAKSMEANGKMGHHNGAYVDVEDTATHVQDVATHTTAEVGKKQLKRLGN